MVIRRSLLAVKLLAAPPRTSGSDVLSAGGVA